jgi:UDP-GlcNAc:undecaprenyl-phosphate GlcNAc-1-phosphate transferase
MLIPYNQFFTLFVISYALVGALTPLMRKIAVTKRIFDKPNSAHKSHIKPIPYLGGVAIILGVVITSYLTLFLSPFTATNFWLATTALAPAIALGMIGLWDDIKNLDPLPRFIGQSIAGLVVASVLVSSGNLGNPTGLVAIDILISVIWVVGICNSINFFDNLDGGAAGTVAISAVVLTYLALSTDQSFIAALSLVVAGSTLGFLIWNKTPARIFMGDAGALFLGVLIATLTVRFEPNTESSLGSFATPLLLLAIPILDTTVAVLSRLRRKISPFQGGRDHLSHRLVRAGLTRKLAAITLWGLTGLFGIFAVLISLPNSGYEVIIVLIALVLWLLLFLSFFRTKDS